MGGRPRLLLLLEWTLPRPRGQEGEGGGLGRMGRQQGRCVRCVEHVGDRGEALCAGWRCRHHRAQELGWASGRSGCLPLMLLPTSRRAWCRVLHGGGEAYL